MTFECEICYSSYTKTTRKMIECNNCEYQCCSQCIQQYILNCNSEVKCMKCNVGWSMNFLFENFPSKFCVQYRHHRREILWNKELYHIPIISEYIEFDKEYQQLNMKDRELKKKINEKKNEYKKLKGKQGKKYTEKRKQIRNEQDEIEEEQEIINTRKHQAYHRTTQIRDNFLGGRNQQTKRTINRPCITENCKGFVNSKGECPICDKVLCIDCNILKVEDDHECKEDDIQTFKELSKNTRPCPKCNVRIHKISGCDQMWCVCCNTAFSWSKGIVETGRIHNPHYFDWLFNGREQNQNLNIVDNDVCNEDVMPHAFTLQRFVQNNSNMSYEQKLNLRNLFQRLEHNIHVDLRRYNINEQNVRDHIFTYLVSYIKGDNNISKNFETFMMKKDLYNEFHTILNNYKRSQIHLFRALLNNSIDYNYFLKNSCQNKQIYYDCIKNFNRFYKKNYKIDF